jgi:hypothetical protein
MAGDGASALLGMLPGKIAQAIVNMEQDSALKRDIGDPKTERLCADCGHHQASPSFCPCRRDAARPYTTVKPTPNSGC